MPIALTCTCGARLSAPDTAAGKKLACPKCKAALPVPKAGGAGKKKPPGADEARKEQKPAARGKARPARDEDSADAAQTTGYHWILFARPAFYLALVAGLLVAWRLSEERLATLAASAEAWADARRIVEVALWVALAYSLVLLLLRLIKFASAEFTVTDSHLVLSTGLLGRSTVEVPLRKVEDFDVRQGILGRRLDYGTLVVTTRGGKHTFAGTAAALAFYRAVQERLTS